MPANDLPDFITQLDELLLEQLALENQLEAAVGAFEARIKEATGSSYERSGIRVSGPGAHAIVEQYQERVEALAVREFSVPGGRYEVEFRRRPSIPHERLYFVSENLDAARTILEPVLPSTYWRQLESAADPEAQTKAQAFDAAVVLAKFVGLVHPWATRERLARERSFTPPRVVKGCFEFAMPGVHVEDRFSSVMVTCSGRAFDLAQALETALSSTEAGAAFAHSLQLTLRRLDRSDFVSRRRVDLGEGGHLVTYRAGSKIYVPIPLGEQINLFISEHLGDSLQVESEAA